MILVVHSLVLQLSELRRHITFWNQQKMYSK